VAFGAGLKMHLGARTPPTSPCERRSSPSARPMGPGNRAATQDPLGDRRETHFTTPSSGVHTCRPCSDPLSQADRSVPRVESHCEDKKVETGPGWHCEAGRFAGQVPVDDLRPYCVVDGGHIISSRPLRSGR